MDQYNFIEASETEKQDTLSFERIKKLTNGLSRSLFGFERPKQNFIDLIEWTRKHFASDSHKAYIHNRIVIDGQFATFCGLNKIDISCLYNDSIVSWKTENGYEKFFIQGVFKITGSDFEFIHASLFHKGNQFEDEISFFVLLEDKYYEKYIEFRNNFDEWVTERDRSNLCIRVMDGDDTPYTRDSSWASLFLPDEIKKDLRFLVESFLNSKDFYLENKIPWKKGILLFGPAGNGKTSIIRTIISNYNFKPVTIAANPNDDSLKRAFSYAENQSPALLYFEDIDSLLERIDVSAFLNLLDGVATKNGLLIIATANDISKLKGNITDRPSRFDSKIKIDLPDEDLCFKYLKSWFGSNITDKKCKELAQICAQCQLSYAYLKDIYITSMFEALAAKRKKPLERDMSNALKRIIKEKNIISENPIKLDKYFK